jgi:hypothetical protein
MTVDRKDLVYGCILIALGAYMIYDNPFTKVDRWLGNAAGKYLDFFLYVIAIICVLVAVMGNDAVKAAIVFWMVSP